MGKRGNEHSQLTKEQYEAAEDGSNDVGVGMARASDATLKKRRIVNVSGRNKWKPLGTPKKTPEAPSASRSTGFLVAETTPVPEKKAESKKSNPFAAVSFASTPAPVATPKPSGSRPTGKREQNLNDLHMFVNDAQMVYSESHPLSNWSDYFEKKLQQMKEMEENEDCDAVFAAASPSLFSSSTGTPEEAPATPFALKAPTPEAAPTTPFASSAPLPFAGFNFSGADASQKPMEPAAPFTGFGFDAKPTGNPTPSLPLGNPSAPAGAAANEDAFPKEKSEEVLKSDDTDEEDVYQVRGKKYKSMENEWKEFGAGIVRLLRSKENPSKSRLLMRNESTGKPMVNVAIRKSMMLKKNVGKKTGYVHFMNVESVGPPMVIEKIMVKVNIRNIDTLHEKLLELMEASD